MPRSDSRGRPLRIGILTGGGDVPGLNAVIRSFVNRLDDGPHEVVGFRNGWASLVHLRPGDPASEAKWVEPLDVASTRKIDRTGGTILHSSRLNPSLLLDQQTPEHLRHLPVDDEGKRDATEYVLEVLRKKEIDGMVAIGGDGTLSFARRLDEEGVPVIAVPKTMDNDVYGTDYSIGFSTAVTRTVRFIHDLRTCAGSHERILIVEVFGRYSGEPCLLASYLASADRALIAEVPFDMERLGDLLAADKRESSSNYAVLVVAEGAREVGGEHVEGGEADAVGHRKLGGVGALIGERLRSLTGEQILYQPLGYLMRSGAPDSLDLLVSKNFGNYAAELILAGKWGRLTAVIDGRYQSVPIEVLGQGLRRVDVNRFYSRKEYRPRVRDISGLPMFLQ